MNAHATSGSMLSRTVTHLELGAPVRVLAVAFAVALTAAAAQFTTPLPGTTVPFTLTPLVVMLTGAALGSRLGALSQGLYLLAGALGAAVFSPSPTLPPGALRLVGPTAGYLWAYPLAAFTTGWLAERGWDRRYLSSLASMLVGLALIFAGGVAWLAAGFTHSLSLAAAQGFAPFIVLDLIKAGVAAAILPRVWQWLGRDQNLVPRRDR